MYYITFLLIFWGSIIEIFNKRKNRFFFNISFLLLTIMTCFRYGQNADYFNYKFGYLNPEDARNSDLFFGYFQDICRFMGLSYEGSVFMCGALMMGLMVPFFYKKAAHSCLSLLILYSLFFLIYNMGGVRQGLAISFLLYGYSFLEKGNKMGFFIVLAIGSLFHLSLITSVGIYFAYNNQIFNKKIIIWLLLGLTVYSALVPDLSWLFNAMFEDRSTGDGVDNKWNALIVRVLYIIPVYFLKPPYGSSGYNARSICITGYFLYCILSFDTLIAGRVESYYRIFLCLYCAYFVANYKWSRLSLNVLVYMLVLHSALFFKNIDTMIGQGGYRSHVTMLNLPFISVFDKSEFAKYSTLSESDYNINN